MSRQSSLVADRRRRLQIEARSRRQAAGSGEPGRNRRRAAGARRSGRRSVRSTTSAQAPPRGRAAKTRDGRHRAAPRSPAPAAGRRARPAAAGGRRRRRLADAAGAGVGRAVVGEIEVDVIVVEHVRARAEHGGEIPAGARMGLVQEGRLLRAGVFQSRTNSIVRPSASVNPATSTALPKACSERRCAGHVVDRAAAVGAEHVERRDLLAEAGLRVRLDDVVEPGLQRRNHRAVDGRAPCRAPTAPSCEGRDAQGPRHAADAGTVDLGGGDDGLRKGDELAGEAGVFRLGPPDRPLRTAEEAAARQRAKRRPTPGRMAERDAPSR